MDELFAVSTSWTKRTFHFCAQMNLWAWQFKSAETHGDGHRIAQLEGGVQLDEKAEVVHIEQEGGEDILVKDV